MKKLNRRPGVFQLRGPHEMCMLPLSKTHMDPYRDEIQSTQPADHFYFEPSTAKRGGGVKLPQSTFLHITQYICCRNRNAGPHNSSPPEPTLASDQVPHCLQALRAHAPGASWSQSCIPVGHDDIRGWPAWSWETEILQQLPIWISTVETKVRRAEFLVLRTEGVEFSSVQSPGTHKYWYFQNTFENSHSENLNGFVDAPLVTVGVNGVWNDVM